MGGTEEIIGIEIFFKQTELLVTFLIVTIGLAFGSLKVKGIGFGSSGVLIIAMLGGFLYQFEPIPILSDLGIVLFLLCVGLEAGPSFFRAFKKHGKTYIGNVIVLLATAGLSTTIIIYLLDLPIGLGLGLFAGSFTSTPGLVSAMQFSPEKEVIFGYGVAYPFGLMGVILFINLMVKILENKMKTELIGKSTIYTAIFRLHNSEIAGQLLKDIAIFEKKSVVVSGIMRDMSLMTASGKTTLLEGDLVRIEGKKEDVEEVGLKLGEKVTQEFSTDGGLDTRSIVVENTSIFNRSLSDLGIRLRFAVSITRIIRSDVEFVPHHDMVLEFGDVVIAVGTTYQLDQLSMFLGHEHHAVKPRVDIHSLAATIFLAFAIGGIIIPIPKIGLFSLGLAGGALISGLLFGHFGRIRNLIGRFPKSATSVLKELGLAIFFVQVGFETGQSFIESLDYSAIGYAITAVFMAIIPMLISFLVGHYILKISISECFGVICGGMTFTPGLDVIKQVDPSEKPIIAYSSVYPVALILIIILVQAIFVILKSFST
ncbi:MAG: hypothetical protein JJT78_10870 [Leptospira sp.]|nr:hypothetical protein [Leptospira sp.]